MNKILAFDVDGTLADRHSNIQQGVKSIFTDPRIKECKILFLTGNTITTVDTIRQKIAELNKIDIYSYSACMGGSIIYDQDNNIIHEKFICKKRLVKILDKCVKKEKDCFFMFMLNGCQVFNHIVSDDIRHMVESQLGAINMDPDEISFDNTDYHTLLKKLPRIHCVNIFSIHDADTIFNTISKEAQMGGYSTYTEPKINMTQISANSKLTALKYILRKLKQDENINIRLRDIVYFGDGGNDTQCLKACDLSFARGKNLPTSVINAAKIYAEDMTPYLDEIFG